MIRFQSSLIRFQSSLHTPYTSNPSTLTKHARDTARSPLCENYHRTWCTFFTTYKFTGMPSLRLAARCALIAAILAAPVPTHAVNHLQPHDAYALTQVHIRKKQHACVHCGVHKGIYGVCVHCTHIAICMPSIVRTHTETCTPSIVRTTLGMRERSEYVCRVFSIA